MCVFIGILSIDFINVWNALIMDSIETEEKKPANDQLMFSWETLIFTCVWGQIKPEFLRLL